MKQKNSLDYIKSYLKTGEKMTKGLHIVHLTSAHPPFDIRIFRKECRSLAAEGYDVKLIAANDQEEVVDAIRILPIAKPSRRLQRMTQTVGQVYRIANLLNADIYHFHDPELIPVGLLLRRKGYKVVYDVHEDAPRSLLSGGRDYLPKHMERPSSWLLDWLEKFAARRFTGIVAATPAIARRFSPLNSNLVTINNYPRMGELVSHVDRIWQDRESSVAYIGAISPIRGLRQMVEAIGLVNTRVAASLELAGRYDSVKSREAVVRLNGWQYTEELGFLERTDVAGLLATVRGGLVIYNPEPNHVEAQPNKLFEYMSAGIPVIASDFPLWRELIERENCGLLVDPLDSASIANAIEYVLTHPDEAEAMGRNGREAVVRSYNWATEEQKLLAFYSKLLSSP